MKNKNFQKIRVAFIIYAIGYFAICLITKYQYFAWLELALLSLIVSAVTLKKEHFPKGKRLILPSVLTVLYLIANIIRFNPFTVFQALVVFLAACASCSVFKNYGEHSLKWIRHEKKSDIFVSIAIGLLCGMVWGGVNYLLMKGSNPIDPADPLKAFIAAIDPAVIEEIAYRCVFFAFCLSMADGELKTRSQRFTAWFMMIVPHILPHMLFSLENGLIKSIIEWLISLVLYIAVFGSIFAILQRKRDVASAMIAHGTVDLIRFKIFGMPA